MPIAFIILVLIGALFVWLSITWLINYISKEIEANRKYQEEWEKQFKK